MSAPAEQYDYAVASQQRARDMFPSAYAPYGITKSGTSDTASAASAAPTAPTAPVGPPTFPEFVAAKEAKEKRKLTPDELTKGKDIYKNDIFLPHQLSRKNVTQFEVESYSTLFDNKADRFIADYNANSAGAMGPQAAQAAQANSDPGMLSTAGDLASAGFFGLGKGLNSIAELAAYGVRASPVGRIYNKLAGTGTYDPASSHFLGLGDFTQYTGQALNDAQDVLTSDRTLAQRAERGKAVSAIWDDPNASITDKIAGTFGESVKSGRRTAALQDVAGIVGQLASTVGVAKALGLMKDAAESGVAAKGLVPWIAKRLATPSVLGAPMAAEGTARFEQSVRDRPISELLADPANKAIYDVQLQLGIRPADAAEKLKDTLIARNLDFTMATQAAANIGTFAAIPGGVPAAIEGRGAANALLRIPATAASQGVQSGAAAAGNQVASNITEGDVTGKPVNPLRNVGRAVVEALPTGVAMGAAFGAIGGPKNPVKPATAKFDTPPTYEEILAAHNDATNGPPPEAAPTAAKATAADTSTAGPGIDPAAMPTVLAKTSAAATLASANSKSAISKAVSKVTTAEELIQQATRHAEDNVPNYAKMDAFQQLDVVEAVTEAFSKKSKVKKGDVGPLLAARRTMLNATPETPTVTATATPDIQPSAPPVEAAAVPVETPEQQDARRADGRAKLLAILPKLTAKQLTTPELIAMKAAYESGVVTDAESLKAFIDNGYKLPKQAAKGKKPLRSKPTVETAPVAPKADEAISKFGSGLAEGVYQAALNTLKGESSASKAEPFYKDLKAAYDAGSVTDLDGVKAFLRNWKKPAAAPEAAPVVPVAPKAAGKKPLKTAPAAPAVEATAPVEAPTAKTAEAKLPDELSKAATNYSHGLKRFVLEFKNDIDRASYFVGGSGKSKSHGKYVEWLKSQGVSEAQARERGQKLRDTIKPLAAAAEKGGPLKVPSIESTPVPKTEAPTPGKASGAGVKETSANPSEQGRETAQDAVKRVLGDSIEGTDATDLATALELARSGDTKPLEEELRNLSGISQADKVALREAGRSETPADRGEAKKSSLSKEAPFVVETKQEGAKRVLDTVRHMTPEETIRWLSKNGPDAGYRAIATLVAKRMAELKAYGATFKQEFITPASLGANLAQYKINHTVLNDRYEATLQYGNKPNADHPGTGWEPMLHENVHVVTALMQVLAKKHPNSELSRVATEIDQLYKQVATHLKEKDYNLLTGTEKWFVDGSGRKGPLENAREFLAWGTTNPEFQQTLKGINLGKATTAWGNLVSLFRNSLGLPKEHETALERLLDQSERLLEGDLDEWIKQVADTPEGFSKGLFGASDSHSGGFSGGDNGAMTLFGDMAGMREKKEKPVPITVSKMQRIGEVMANSVYGLERALQEAAKQKLEVSTDDNPYIAGSEYTSNEPEFLSTDLAEVVNPVHAYIDTNFKQFADSKDIFHKYTDQFLKAWHQVTERIPDTWARKVPLSGGRDITRADIVDKINEGKIDPKEGMDKIRKLAAQYADQPLEEWAKASNNSMDLAPLRKILADLKVKGFDERSMAEYNKALDPVRQRTRERMMASGRISQNDHWVEANGWKWYVPLKGEANASEALGDQDYGTYKGATAKFRSRKIDVAEGRKTEAAGVAEQLVSDLSHEGRKHAEGILRQNFFNFVQNHIKNMGKTTVTIVKGIPATGYTRTAWVRNKSTGKLEPRQVPVKSKAVFTDPENGFVVNQGDTHFIVNLDPNDAIAGQLAKGIKGFNNVQSWNNSLVRTASKGTNLVARTYTTFAPWWVFFKGFVRDSTSVPFTVAAEAFDSPTQTGPFFRGYYKRLLANAAGIADVSTSWAELQGNRSLLRKKADADPSSFAGRLFRYREAGGSTEFSQSLNPEGAKETLFGPAPTKGLRKAVSPLVKGYEQVNKYTSNWAQLLEMKGRLAAFDTLVDDLHMDPRKAAALAKGAMDFGKSGEWGKKINGFIAFYRVGATQADTLRRIFSTPEGNANWAKMAKYSAFFGGLGVSAFMMGQIALGDDENGDSRMAKIDINTLTQKIVIPDGSGGTVGYAIGLGLPQLMMAPGIVAAAYANGHITAGEAADAMYKVYARNGPLSPAGWVKDTGVHGFINSWVQALAPTVIRPITETAMNEGSFDTPIHTTRPDDTNFLSNQGLPNTAPEWTDMAKELRTTLGVDMYPEDIKHFASGYLGQPLSAVMRLTVDKNNNEDQGLDNNAVADALSYSVNDEKYYYSREMNKALAELKTTERRYKDVKDNPQEVARFREDRSNVLRLNALHTLEKAKKAYYKALTAVRNSNAGVEGQRYARKRADSTLRQAVESAQKVLDSTD